MDRCSIVLSTYDDARTLETRCIRVVECGRGQMPENLCRATERPFFTLRCGPKVALSEAQS